MTVSYAGTPVQVASLDDLIASKEGVDRPADREALPELRALRDAQFAPPAQDASEVVEHTTRDAHPRPVDSGRVTPPGPVTSPGVPFGLD